MADQQNDDAQERTEQATPRKLEQAREKGQVARSRELSTSAVLLISAAGFTLTGPQVVDDLVSLMSHNFRLSVAVIEGDLQLDTVLMDSIVIALRSLAPFMALVAVVAIGASAALGGINFSVKSISFKWEKLNPVKGMKRVFSVNGLMELFKALAKFVIVTGTTVVLLRFGMEKMLSLNTQSLDVALPNTVSVITFSFLCFGAATLLVALVDVPFQIWNHAKQMRMTRREVKDDLKETDGKPEVKARIRSLQREISQRRMMEAIPDADVVITNPTHFAVALSYKPESMEAPKVVAKGADLLASRIREVAAQHDVAVVESPLLARSVFFNTRLGDEVPVGLYLAVAQVLAYVFRLKEWSGAGEAPQLAEDLPIPEHLKPRAQ